MPNMRRNRDSKTHKKQMPSLLTGFTEEESVKNSKGTQKSHHYLYS